MGYLDHITLPDSPAARLIYVIIITANAIVSYRLPSSLQGLLFTCVIYSFLLTDKVICKTLALLLSLFRLSQVFPIPNQLPFWSMLVTYCLSFLICWIMYKLSVSPDNTQLLTLFNVKLLDPPILYLKILDQTAAYFSWEHSSPERHLLSYEIEINNVIIGHCEPNERSIGIPSLRPNTIYRIRIWANSRTRGRAPSSYLMFKTLEETPETSDSLSPRKESSVEEQIKRLESDRDFLHTSRENIRQEFDQLQSDDQPAASLFRQLVEVKTELVAMDKLLLANQAEVEALREEKSKLVSERNSLEHQTDDMTTMLNRTEASLKARLKEIESEERGQACHPAEVAVLEKRFKGDKARLEHELKAIVQNNNVLESTLSVHTASFKKLQEELKEEETKYQRLLDALSAAKEEEARLGGGSYDLLKKYCELVSVLGQRLSDKKELSEQLGELSAKKLTLLHSLAQLNHTRPPLTEIERNPLVASIPWMRPAEPTPFVPRFESLLSRPHSTESFSTDFPWPRVQPTWTPPQLASSSWTAGEEVDTTAEEDQSSVPSWLLPSRSSFESSSAEELSVDSLYTPSFTSAPWSEAPRLVPSFSAWPNSQPLSRRSTFRTFSSFPSPFSDGTESAPRVTTAPMRAEDESDKHFQEVFGSMPRMAPPSQHHPFPNS
ncbi:hypothetical protein DSO57_1035543 [Entomophthora muscae]|uniref:Uncharacterized protein n=1 Tax=Entomophthora muscae TaxID=34485 RepID=A0ACC2SC63_9FUNG|nr:hypothetical protein DSO57_1035543 [Entomophthora muscae]